MMTRRTFLTLAGMVMGATAVHLLPLMRGVSALARLPISTETAVPTSIPMQVGESKPLPYQLFIPAVTGGQDGH